MEDKTLEKLDSYLSFCLNGEEYATNVGSVLSIIEIPIITKVPKAPEYVLGIINLRGEVLPVIDMHYKFGLSKVETTTNNCILVMESTVEQRYVKFGVLVDAVKEVYQFDPSKIMPAPSIGNKIRSEFISGIYNQGDSFIMIIDIEAILTTEEASVMVEPMLEESIATE